MVRRFIFAIFKRIIRKGWLKWMPDPLYLKIYYYLVTGKKLHLRKPSTFNEKLQWLKIHDHNPLYTTLVDKYEVKAYIAQKIGEEYVIPTLGVWNKAEDIDFDSLPDKFVLKTTHDSGGIKIVDKKKGYNKEQIISFFNERLKKDLYMLTREWPYKNVKHRIIAEKYMEENNKLSLNDYKFYAFDGVVKVLMIVTGRGEDNTCANYYDMNFKKLDLTWGYPQIREEVRKPESFLKMKEIAEVISKGIAEVRVDFYEVDGKAYFGEITFFDGSGFAKFEPEKWDKKFGEWINLPQSGGGF